MVFGGSTGDESDDQLDRGLCTENCTVVGSKIECNIQEPNLKDWTTYPELFIVEPDFCDT